MKRADISRLQTAVLRWLDDSSSQGIFTTDDELSICSWNSWLERQSGRQAADVVGLPLLEAFPEIAERGLEPAYRGALKGQVSVLAQPFHRYLLEIPIRGEGQATSPMAQSCRIAPLLTAGDTIVGTVTVIDDVTDRVRSEAELRRQIAAAEEARETAEQALRMKDEFLTTLSHEIRTPLNAVAGWTRILLSRKVDSATLENALQVIERNARVQSRLVEDMLDMARIVSGKLRLVMAPVDLVSATAAAIEVVAPTAAAKGVTIRAALDDKPHVIVADADRVQQIVWNLLSNAIKFTPRGGTVEIEVSSDAEATRLVIRDNGQGITPEFLPFVFERFRQANASTSRTEGGLGLGLALVRQLVELHGGRITAESGGPGKGARFTVVFPDASGDRVDRSELGVRVAGTALAGVRVFVVDDDADWRQLLTLALEHLGANVQSAGTAAEAIDLLKNARPGEIDVMLADIGMPEADGYTFLDQVRQLTAFSTTPVIAVTAYAGETNAQRALAAGFERHCSKPADPDALARVILDVLGRASKR